MDELHALDGWYGRLARKAPSDWGTRASCPHPDGRDARTTLGQAFSLLVRALEGGREVWAQLQES